MSGPQACAWARAIYRPLISQHGAHDSNPEGLQHIVAKIWDCCSEACSIGLLQDGGSNGMATKAGFFATSSLPMCLPGALPRAACPTCGGRSPCAAAFWVACRPQALLLVSSTPLPAQNPRSSLHTPSKLAKCACH